MHTQPLLWLLRFSKSDLYKLKSTELIINHLLVNCFQLLLRQLFPQLELSLSNKTVIWIGYLYFPFQREMITNSETVHREAQKERRLKVSEAHYKELWNLFIWTVTGQIFSELKHGNYSIQFNTIYKTLQHRLQHSRMLFKWYFNPPQKT